MGDSDPLVQEAVQTRRKRRRVIVVAVIAILVGAAAGIAVTLGAISRTW
ncbi:MAG: hypothetical protein ACKV2T_23260 [Kofleriaceae bacterium]